MPDVVLGAIGDEIGFGNIAPVEPDGYARRARLVKAVRIDHQELFLPRFTFTNILWLGVGADDKQYQGRECVGGSHAACGSAGDQCRVDARPRLLPNARPPARTGNCIIRSL
jgi:hypothetical protein